MRNYIHYLELTTIVVRTIQQHARKRYMSKLAETGRRVSDADLLWRSCEEWVWEWSGLMCDSGSRNEKGDITEVICQLLLPRREAPASSRSAARVSSMEAPPPAR